ncbi:phospho-N-acetylmuramoyl-pentapeptide-transferase [Patescibacteria group bacterium]|nr:phospho-N-acetylmuramoyl-pentapeptide-transferase [Patescibacteria group bacterium]
MNPNLAISISHLNQIFLFVTVSFLIAFILTPLLTNFLYKNRIGKRLRLHGVDGKEAPIFSKIHENKAGTPVMGGLLFWVTTGVLTLLFNLNRSETWLPVFALISAGIIGAVDDLMNVRGKGHNGGGLRLRHKFWIYAGVAVIGAWWFYAKLGWDFIYIPILARQISIGFWYVPFFIGMVIFSAFSVNQTDGLDGLAGGVAMAACFVFTLLALAQGKVHLAIFCATLLGSLLAFLWFNIYPARFFMGDTGSMALGFVLPILAFLTDSSLVLPLILLIPFIEGIATIIQIISKKVFHRKVFLIAPIHHHFEAVGWPESKVTMRFWVIAAVGCSIGLMIMLVGR